MLAQNARMTLTRADYETELARLVPEEHRAEFAGSPQGIAGLLNVLLVRKTLAAEAREAGLDREPLGEGAGVDVDTILSQRLLPGWMPKPGQISTAASTASRRRPARTTS